MDNIISVEQTERLGNKLKQQAKRVVLVGGCFDLLHYGHITLLEEAKKQGDTLIVLLESDKRIQSIKGSQRPLHTQKQRAKMLIALKSVDYVVLLPDKPDYDKVVKLVQPAIIATTKQSDSLRYIEKQAQNNNATIYLVPKVKNISTSRILDVVRNEL